MLCSTRTRTLEMRRLASFSSGVSSPCSSAASNPMHLTPSTKSPLTSGVFEAYSGINDFAMAERDVVVSTSTPASALMAATSSRFPKAWLLPDQRLLSQRNCTFPLDRNPPKRYLFQQLMPLTFYETINFARLPADCGLVRRINPQPLGPCKSGQANACFQNEMIPS